MMAWFRCSLLHPAVLTAMVGSIIAATPCWAATIDGYTEPYRQVDVAAGAPGIIAELLVEPGQRVAEGQLLATLDAGVLEAAHAVARLKAQSTGEIDAAAAELRLKQHRVGQIRGLRREGHSSEHELMRAEVDVEIAEARYKVAEQAIRLHELEVRQIEAQIARHRVISPTDGIVADIPREVGEALAPNDPRVTTLVQLDRLRVRYPVLPSLASRFDPGQEVLLTLPDIDATIVGRVDRVGPLVDARSGTLEVHVVISNSDGTIRSGTRCILRLDDGSAASGADALSAVSQSRVPLP